MTLKHSHQTAIADDPAYDVGADEWNGDHVVSGTSLQVQYNNAGSLTGMSGSSWDNTTRALTLDLLASNLFKISKADTNYNEVSFNGSTTFTTAIAVEGGAAGDPNMYLYVPIGGSFRFTVAGTDYLTIDVNGLNAGVSDLPLGQSGAGWGLVYLKPGTLAQRNSWGAAKGAIGCITDSNTTTWGATISGGGSNSVLAWYNGTNWTVIGA